MIYRILKIISVVFVLIFLTGCPPRVREKFVICPGKASINDSISALRANAEVLPFSASGQCLATVYSEKNKRHRENFSIKLWFNPPSELRLFGDIAFDARGLDIGSNENEFWLGAKMKQLGNSFYWGRWSEQQGFVRDFYPVIFLDAFGGINFDNTTGWSLSNEGPFDVLTLKVQDKVAKKIYIYACDYRVRKIEYFDINGNLSAVLELSNYSNFFDGCNFARLLLLHLPNPGQKNDDTFKITLEKVSAYQFTGEKREAFFGKPENLTGYGHIYKITGNTVIEQEK